MNQKRATGHRRRDPGRGSADPWRGSGLLRSRRELSGGDRRDVRQARADAADRLPPGGRRSLHGRSLRQADRTAGHLLRHPWPRRHQRQHRRAHRLPGLLADDLVHRAGRRRYRRARGVSGSRLPAHVRPDDQVGRADRPRRADPGVCEPRIPSGRLGSARARWCWHCPKTCSRPPAPVAAVATLSAREAASRPGAICSNCARC